MQKEESDLPLGFMLNEEGIDIMSEMECFSVALSKRILFGFVDTMSSNKAGRASQ